MGQLAKVLVQRPTQYIAWKWKARHQEWAQAQLKDAASQAIWESLALVMAIETWKDVMLPTGSRWYLLGDALGVLQGATQFHSKDPAINKLFMELALIVVEAGREIHAEHLWSEKNNMADDLSRLHEGAKLPQQLWGVPRAKAKEPTWNIIHTLQHAEVETRFQYF